MDKYPIHTTHIAAQRAHQFERARLAVRHRLFEAYHLDTGMLPLDPENEARLADAKQSIFKPHWQKGVAAAKLSEKYTPKQLTELANIAEKGLADYLEGFRLRYLIFYRDRQQIAPDRIIDRKTHTTIIDYKDYDIRTILMDAYLNHVTNRIEEEFCAKGGVEPMTAHQLNGKIIVSALRCSDTVTTGMSAYLNPMIGSTTSTDAIKDFERRQHLLRSNFPRELRAALKEGHLTDQER